MSILVLAKSKAHQPVQWDFDGILAFGDNLPGFLGKEGWKMGPTFLVSDSQDKCLPSPPLSQVLTNCWDEQINRSTQLHKEKRLLVPGIKEGPRRGKLYLLLGDGKGFLDTQRKNKNT